MAKFALTTATVSPSWRTMATGVGDTALLSADSITDAYGRRMVARAKWRFDTARGLTPSMTDEASYIAAACQPGQLKGLCFVAADEIALDLTRRGADAKCVRVVPQPKGGDHYFTVVNRGSAATSLIVDATWLQFSLNGSPFCLAGTLSRVSAALTGSQTQGFDLVAAYEAGLQVVKRWSGYDCFT